MSPYAPSKRDPDGQDPLVSILLPARDAEGTLAACLRSIERQSFRRFRCVLVDDGSRDGTAEIARAFARRDPRFLVVRQPRLGLVAALNQGLELCDEPYVARMDADDLMHRRRLEQQRLALEAEPRLAGVGCHVRIFPRAKLAAGFRDYEAWLRAIDAPRRVREEAFVECPLPHPTWMLRRSVFAELGYRDRAWPEDYDLLLRILGRGDELGVVPRRLHLWRDTPERLWRTGASYHPERFLACKAHYLADDFLAQTPRYILWGYGETGKALRRALVAHGREPAHIVELHPRRIGERIHGAPVIAPDTLVDVPRRRIVVSVARAGPRREIRTWLTQRGYRELEDFVCAA